jgi:hypothetical protein
VLRSFFVLNLMWNVECGMWNVEFARSFYAVGGARGCSIGWKGEIVYGSDEMMKCMVLVVVECPQHT